jgi:hypothetical protein
MENLIFLLATSLVLRRSPAKKLQHYYIGDTGCSALLSSKHDFEKTSTESGDDLYFHEYSEGQVTFGIICIDLREQYDPEHATEMLRAYINKLKRPFFVLHQTGLQKDMDWNNVSSSTVIDYWQDADKNDWKIKAYTNGRFMSILYVKNIAQAEAANVDFFLDSFYFSPVS